MTSLNFDIYLRSTPKRVWAVLTDPGKVPAGRFGMSSQRHPCSARCQRTMQKPCCSAASRAWGSRRPSGRRGMGMNLAARGFFSAITPSSRSCPVTTKIP